MLENYQALMDIMEEMETGTGGSISMEETQKIFDKGSKTGWRCSSMDLKVAWWNYYIIFTNILRELQCPYFST